MKHRIHATPVGQYAIVVAETAAITGIYRLGQRHLPPDAELGERNDQVAEQAVQQLDEYFAGTRTQFELPLDPRGTDFQRQVWAGLAQIPYGQTMSYGELAAELGRPGAARAVGAATGRNPISIVVPCHRLVGSSGALIGYAGGADVKQALLDLERGVLGAQRA